MFQILLAGTLLAGAKAHAQAERCAVEPLVQDFTVSGRAGPLHAPIGPRLYEYLLDRPGLVAALLAELGLPQYKVVQLAAERYLVDDGEGAQGMFTLAQRTPASRVYLIDGVHEGRMLPRVRACAVLFVTFEQGAAADGTAGMSTRALVYARLEDPMLAGLAIMLRPLAGYLVSRKLSRGVDAAAQLATLIAQEPERVAQAAGRLATLAPEDRRELLRLMQQKPAVRPTRRRRKASRYPVPGSSSRCSH